MVDQTRIQKVIDERISKTSLNNAKEKSANSGSNLIEPTLDMIEEVIKKRLAGESIRSIKKSVKNSSGKKLSFGQIEDIFKVLENHLAKEDTQEVE